MGLTRRKMVAGLAGVVAAPRIAAAATSNRQVLEEAAAPLDGPHQIISLWPGDAPGMPRTPPAESVEDRKQQARTRDRFLAHPAWPRLVVFRPEKPNGGAVLLCPGGGYQRLALDREPYECAPRFTREGFTCFVLINRLPGDAWASGPDAPLQDAIRAMRLIRARAQEWKIDPARVTAMGFSAGGHLGGWLAMHWDAMVYPRVDAADDLSARPDAAVLLYPVGTMTDPLVHKGSRDALLGPKPSDEMMRRYSLEQMARADAPPTFLAAAADDATVPVQNTVLLYEALLARKVPVEMHIFENGGHGFGFGILTEGKPVAAWPELALAFLRKHRMMG